MIVAVQSVEPLEIGYNILVLDVNFFMALKIFAVGLEEASKPNDLFETLYQFNLHP